MLTHQLLPLNGSNGKIKFLGSFIPYGMFPAIHLSLANSWMLVVGRRLEVAVGIAVGHPVGERLGHSVLTALAQRNFYALQYRAARIFYDSSN